MPCYAVTVMFTLRFHFCIWTKNLTYISQRTSNNIISYCKSNLQLCPMKRATAKTSWEYVVFTSVFPIIDCATYMYILYIYIHRLYIYLLFCFNVDTCIKHCILVKRLLPLARPVSLTCFSL